MQPQRGAHLGPPGKIASEELLRKPGEVAIAVLDAGGFAPWVAGATGQEQAEDDDNLVQGEPPFAFARALGP